MTGGEENWQVQTQGAGRFCKVTPYKLKAQGVCNISAEGTFLLGFHRSLPVIGTQLARALPTPLLRSVICWAWWGGSSRKEGQSFFSLSLNLSISQAERTLGCYAHRHARAAHTHTRTLFKNVKILLWAMCLIGPSLQARKKLSLFKL